MRYFNLVKFSKFIFILSIGIFYFSSIFSQSYLKNKNEQVKIIQTLFVDSVVSDFPVSFSMLSSGSWYFVAYYDKNRQLTVASRNGSKKKWNYFSFPTQVGWDSHNSITMAFDKNNCIHISGNMHADTMLYFKTTKPFDIKTFVRVFPLISIEDELKCTYPYFMTDPNKNLVYSYRKGGSGNGNTIINIYDPSNSTFKRLSDQPLFDGLGEMSSYAEGPVIGPDGYYHLTWFWRDTPGCETNHDLSHARSKDLIHWETMSGEISPLPLTPSNTSFIVDPIKVNSGALNGISKLFFDTNNNPLLVYMKYDLKGYSQLFIVKFDQNNWKISQVSNWEYRWNFFGPGSISNEIKIIGAGDSNDGKIKISYWHIKKGNGELIIDKNSFKTIEDKSVFPEETLQYPSALTIPFSNIPGMSVKWLKSKSNSNTKNYFAFRWETLGIRRYYEKPKETVPASALNFYLFKKNKK